MNALVGLLGKKRSGKDSFAQTLVEERGFTRFAFADPLKEALLHLNPVIGSRWEFSWLDANVDDLPDEVRLRDLVDDQDWDWAKEYPEVRRLLQEFGMSIRNIDPHFWIRATMRPAAFVRAGGPVVITDVRFENEVDAIRREGGILARVVRPGLVADDAHVSENEANDIDPDFVVYNEGTLADLAEAARRLPLT